MNKREHIKAARALLDSGTEEAVRYAALELRMAMESITYAKLRAYAKRVPESVFDTWQPPQAMKALLQFEPHAARQVVVSFRRESGDGTPTGPRHLLGESRSFDLAWLRKSYNKLGSLLHIPSPKQAAKSEGADTATKRRAALVEMLAEVERVAASTLEGSIAPVIYFNCSVCERDVVCNEKALRDGNRATCLEPSCSAEHVALFNEDGSVQFVVDATGFDCAKCQHVTPVQNRLLDIGASFCCEACGATHVFVKRTWGYSLEGEP